MTIQNTAKEYRSQAKHSSPTKVAVASFIGTSIEWFDFFLYGTASALVFGKLFFPTDDPLMGTLLAFGSFGVGFAARPIGGAVFGNLADKVGRKNTLVITLLIMGIATACIGLLPTHGQIGIAAPLLLVFLRLVQGFGVGGEWGAAVLMAVEHAPETKKGFFGSIPQMGAPAGTLMATGSFALLTLLPEEDFLSWGWRLPFLASFVLVIIGLIIRVSLTESPEFQNVAQTGRIKKTPVLSAVRDHWRVILISAGIRFSENSVFYVVTVFAITYGVDALGLERGPMLNAVLICSAIELALIPLFGRMSERFGHRRLFLIAAMGSVAVAFPFFMLLNTGNFFIITGAMTICIALAAVMYALEPAIMGSLFPAEVRTSAVSLGYQVASVFAGGLSPFIAAGLYAWSGRQWWPIATYLMVMGLITFVSAHFATKHAATLKEQATQEM